MEDQIQELLAIVDFEKFYREKVEIKSHSNDELKGICPFHEDKVASFCANVKNGLWHCFGCTAEGSIFQFIEKFEKVTFPEAVKILANFSGFKLKNPKEESPPIDSKLPKKYLEKFLQAKDVLKWVIEKKGLTLNTIKKYKIGWDGNRNTIPIYDGKGILQNIRRYNQKKAEKMISYRTKKYTYGKSRLYGLDELLKRKNELIIQCEGEWDKLLASQHGFLSITGTTGAGTFKLEWRKYFVGRDVAIIYDLDPEGRKGAENAARAILDVAATVKNVELPLKGTKDEKDLSDYFLKLGATAEDLQDLIDATPLFVIEPEVPEEEAPKILKSFIEIDLKKNIDKRVQVPLTVSGETSEAFHGVSKFRVDFCKLQTAGKCPRCPADKIFVIQSGEKEFIESCMSTESVVIGFLRYRICPEAQKPRITILEKSTVREFFATQRTKRFFARIGEIGVDESGAELVERRVYFVSDKLVRPQSYLATGYVRTHPKTQQVCLLVTELEPIEEEFESFRLNDETQKSLQQIQELTPKEIVDVLSEEVLFLRHREELILAILLTFCSPLRINFNRIDIRGWLNLIILGDTSTGKTACISRFCDYVSIGDMVSGLTSSRTGITYGLKEHKQKGWMIKIGRYPANTRKFVCIDEIQYIKARDVRTLGKAMDEGFITIDRIAEKSLESMTRLVALANPREDGVMDEMMFGCEGFRDLFDKAIVRRFDLAMCLSHSDIKTNELNLPNVEIKSEKIPAKVLRNLIFWVWTRPSKFVKIEKKATEEILGQAIRLSEKFGFALDVPLVAPGDFANKVARLSTAYAALCVSSDKKYEKILVQSEHVKFVSSLVDFIYSGEAFGLKEYAEIYKEKTLLTDYDGIKKALEKMKKNEKEHDSENFDFAKQGSRIEKLLYAFKMHEEIRRRELADEIDSDERTVSRKLQVLSQFNLIDTGPRGYKKKPKFIKFLRRLARDSETSLHPDKIAQFDMEE